MRANHHHPRSRFLTIALGVVVAAAGLFALLSGPAQAAPLMRGIEASTEASVLLVRDGCGPGMRFSNGRQRCVPDFDRGPPPPRYGYDRGGPPARVYIEPGYRRPPPPPPPRVFSRCGPGQRFSNSRQACVWN